MTNVSTTPVYLSQSSWHINNQGESAWRQQVEIAADTTRSTEGEAREITRSHWKSSDTCSNCSNRGCKKKFSLLERPHHCRRCGEVFCSQCVNYKRKLNLLAHPDPYGKSYKVCHTCFEEGVVHEGQVRRLTEYFYRLRSQGVHASVVTENGKVTKSWRQRFNLNAECTRLIQGFKSSIGNSEIKRTLNDLTTLVTVPDWQKSATWIQENMAETCQKCATKFSLTRKKLNCKVCGRAICKLCSTKDLLLYVPNDSKERDPKLSVIRVVGCPEKEPDIALYLRVCGGCQKMITNKQVQESIEEDKDAQERGDNLVILNNLHKSFMTVSEKMDKQMTQYQTVIESLEDNTRRGNDARKSNIKTVAKAQEDIADFQSQYVLKIQKMKQLKPTTNTQAMLFRNCLKSKCDYYLENQYVFRKLKRDLEKSAPAETLVIIQQTVDLHAITSAQLYVRQLLFETIHICDKYNLEDNIPALLSPLDGALESDAKKCLENNGEDWEEHVANMTEMIKLQMKDHRLIKLSRSLLAMNATEHAQTMLFKRSNEILHQVQVQLDMKSTDKNFQTSKSIISQTRDEVGTARVNIREP